ALLKEKIRKFGYDDATFWAQLESVSSAALAAPRTCTSQECADAGCSARYEALEAARRLFGRSEFDRFLYTAVAPNRLFSVATTDKQHDAALRRTEAGCR